MAALPSTLDDVLLIIGENALVLLPSTWASKYTCLPIQHCHIVLELREDMMTFHDYKFTHDLQSHSIAEILHEEGSFCAPTIRPFLFSIGRPTHVISFWRLDPSCGRLNTGH